MCVSDCTDFKIRVGRSGFFFFFSLKPTSMRHPLKPLPLKSHKPVFLSYYSLLIIWHAVQCFWFQTSIKCTRKWRKFRQYRNSQASIVEFWNKHGDEFPDFVDLFFFFWYKKCWVGGNILGSVDRSETHILFFFGLEEKIVFIDQ
jgi:hypothetical protein